MTTTAPSLPVARPRGTVGRLADHRLVLSPLVAVVAVGIGLALGWHGVDVAASVHRIDEFRRYGYSLWDGSWYGGQWTLDYSIAFAPVTSWLGLPLVALLSAAVATFSFQFIVDRHLVNPGSRVQATATIVGLLFALGNVVQTSIGQLPYLSGEALGLAALAAAVRRLWVPALGLAVASTLFSPLAGLFVAIAAGAWALVSLLAIGRRRRESGLTGEGRAWTEIRGVAAIAGVAAATLVPIAVTSVLFPGEGQMPFDLTDCAWDVAIAAAVWLATSKQERVLRAGIAIYAVALIGSWAVASPLGGNVGRLGDVLALPLAALALWSKRKVVLVVLAVPLVMSSWLPAADAMTSIHRTPATTEDFYRPLVRWLSRTDPSGIDGRVEVVPTFYHWESVWVANVVPLARGWERQSDVTLNPLFYRSGALAAGAYHQWLVDNGVRWVALPRTKLDFAGTQEAKVVKAGGAGLTPVWHNPDWRVYRVEGGGGLVTGDATVSQLGNASVTVRANAAGTFTVRERANSDWHLVAGTGCLRATATGGWIRLHVPKPETVTLRLSLAGPSTACRSS